MSSLPDGWADTTFGEVFDRLQYGLTAKADSSAGGVRFLRITDIEDGQINWRSVPGKAARIEQPSDAVFASYLIRGKLLCPEASDWVKHFISSNAYLSQINERAAGIGMSNVNATKLASVTLSFPPISEQKRAVAKIDSLSAKSKLARDHLNHIFRLIQKYKQAMLTAEFQALDECANEMTLDQLAVHITSGSRDWSQYYDRGNCVFVLAGNIRPMAFDATPKQYVDPPMQGSDARRTRVEANDLLFTIVGANTGNVCYVPRAVENYFVCQSVALVRLREPALARFIELFLNTETAGKAQIDKLIYGQGRPHLSFADLKALRIPVVEITKVQAIVQRIETAFGMIRRLASEATNARKLIDHLDQAVLAKAFRGELVPQDPNDEPATVLLERIRAERAAARPARERGPRRAEKGRSGAK
jgi:type I restriction enzyme S subunit